MSFVDCCLFEGPPLVRFYLSSARSTCRMTSGKTQLKEIAKRADPARPARTNKPRDRERERTLHHLYMGGYPNCGPLLGPLNTAVSYSGKGGHNFDNQPCNSLLRSVDHDSGGLLGPEY